MLFTTSFQAPKLMGASSTKLQIDCRTGEGADHCVLQSDGKLPPSAVAQILLWDLASVKPVDLADFPGARHDLQFNSDGSKLLVAGGRPPLRAWPGSARLPGKWTQTIKEVRTSSRVQLGTTAPGCPGSRQEDLSIRSERRTSNADGTLGWSHAVGFPMANGCCHSQRQVSQSHVDQNQETKVMLSAP